MRRRKGKKGKTEEIVQEIPGRRKFCQFQDITHFHSSVSFTLSFPSSVVVFIFASALLKIWAARNSHFCQFKDHEMSFVSYKLIHPNTVLNVQGKELKDILGG